MKLLIFSTSLTNGGVESQPEKLYKGHKNVAHVAPVFSKLEPKTTKNLLLEVSRTRMCSTF